MFDREFLDKLCKDPNFPEPHHGAVLESLFGLTEMEIIHSMAGSTQASKEPRSMPRQTNPELQAILTYKQLEAELSQFICETYHPVNGAKTSPFIS